MKTKTDYRFRVELEKAQATEEIEVIKGKLLDTAYDVLVEKTKAARALEQAEAAKQETQKARTELKQLQEELNKAKANAKKAKTETEEGEKETEQEQ